MNMHSMKELQPALSEKQVVEFACRYMAKMYYVGYNNARNNKYTEADMESVIDSEWPKFSHYAKDLIQKIT